MLWLYGPIPSSKVYGILMILGSLVLKFFFWMDLEFRVYHGFVNHLLSSFWIFLFKFFFFFFSKNFLFFFWKFFSLFFSSENSSLKKNIYKIFFLKTFLLYKRLSPFLEIFSFWTFSFRLNQTEIKNFKKKKKKKKHLGFYINWI